MQINRDYESEISLKNLFFYLLYRWRSILIAALIGAVLFGGYKYISLRNVLHTENTTEEQLAYENDLTTIRSIIQSRSNQINNLEAYRNESIYFQLNPQAIWMASCKYLILLDPDIWVQLPQNMNEDPVDSILAAYTMPFSEINDDEAKDIFDVVKPEYACELIEVIANTTENTVTICVKGPTKEYVQRGLEFLKEKVESFKKKAQMINAHTALEIGEESIILADKDLLEKQELLQKAINQDKEILQTYQNMLIEAEANGGPQNARKQLIKYAIIGFVLGALLLICLYIFRYVFCSRLMEGKELSEQYNLPLLGEIIRSGSLHNNKGLDKLFSRWELGKNATNSGNIYNNISAIINEKQDIDNILLISSLNEEKLKSVKDALTSRLPEKRIEIMGSFLTNGGAIAEVQKADAVILVEKKQKTRMKDIERVAEMLSVSEANLAGAIVL